MFTAYRFRFFLTVLCALSAVGCTSYPFGAGSRALPGGYNKISVPIFQNRTAEPGIEPYFTAAMIEEMNRGHKAEVTDRTDSQVVLEGEIMSIRYDQGPMCDGTTGSICPAVYQYLPVNAVIVTQYRVTVTANLILRRISDGSVIWSGDFKGEQQYAAPQITIEANNASDPLYNQSARNQTLKIIARAMMTEAYDRLTENF